MATAMALTALSAAAETVSVDGHAVWYEVVGDAGPGRAPILMLHGGAMHFRSSFGDMLAALPEGHAVIGVEQQGHGHTPNHEGPITLAAMRRDTLAVLDALGVERAHVVGFSAGGMLGLELAVNAPARVASLTAISAAQDKSGFLPEIIRSNEDPSYQPPPEVAALLPSPDQFAQMSRETAALNPGGDAAVKIMMEKMNRFITSDWGWTDAELAGIAAPVQIVQGDTDFIRTEHALHMQQTIPGAWLAVLPHTTHMDILARPELPALVGQLIAVAEARR